MKTCLAVLALVASFARAETWTGKLVDATCKASSEASCPASAATHLFALELSDSRILILDARGNEKAADAIDAIKDASKSGLRATVTGSLEGRKIKVETLELQ
jgi:hypothetical protein